MTQLAQVPFSDVTFVDNPEPRCPCVLLLDTSSSMSGARINQLNAGLKQFQKELAADAMASKRVEIAIITFGPVRVVQDFITPDLFTPTELVAEGDTPMGAAIAEALELITSAETAVPGQRRRLLPPVGIPHHRRCADRPLRCRGVGHQGR